MKISKRLESCAKYTEGFLNLADIGTDHALLPILCVQEGYVLKAQAIDNKEGPYVIAYSNVKKQNLEKKIKVILGDGFEKISDDTDVVVISGMGGDLISRILQNDSTRNIKRFIIQPNNNADIIRGILHKINYKIVDEIILEDNNKIYEMLILEPGMSQLNELEIKFGPYNVKNKPYYFKKKINKEIIVLESIINKITNLSEKSAIQDKINVLKEVIR